MKKIKLFICKSLFIGSPLLILIILYIIKDPFKVIYHYDSYYKSGKPNYIMINRDFVSFETFCNNYPESKFDSYIFGNSRSIFYQISDWQKYIGSRHCYHFDASDESLYGINIKIKYLFDHKIPIKNSLIILDFNTLKETKNHTGHLFLKHPSLTKQNYFLFQLEYFRTFIDKNFLTAYIDFIFNTKVTSVAFRIN